MAFRIRTDSNNKIVNDAGYMYVTDVYSGIEAVVGKHWVIENIDMITNAAVSGNTVYSVKDKLNTAITMLTTEYITQAKKRNGFNLSAHKRLVEYPKYVFTNSLNYKSTTKELWDYIKTIQLPMVMIGKIFEQICGNVHKYYTDKGMKITEQRINNDIYWFVGKNK